MKVANRVVKWAAVLGGVVTLVSGSPQSAHAAEDSKSKSATEKARYFELSPDERKILDNGEISEGSYVAGGILGTVFGFGIGQAVQGRYLPSGLIMTAGEAAGVGLIEAGLVNCTADAINTGFQSNQNCSHGLLTAGVIVYFGVRVWEIVDVWATPPELNRRYRSLKERVGDSSAHFFMLPSSSPTLSRVDGATVGVQWHF